MYGRLTTRHYDARLVPKFPAEKFRFRRIGTRRILSACALGFDLA
jgi:hypothetical protein